MHAVMKHWHPMMGVDFHIPWPPGSPAPAPSPVPYKTTMWLMGTGFTCSMARSHVSMGWGFSMQLGTDIGPMIPHIGPPSILLPLEIILSSSKSYFGVARYPIENKPIAVAALMIVNPNLNCGTPMPTPTGFVLALNTHFVNMSMADWVYGYTYMFLDWGLQTLLQFVGGKVGGLLAAKAALPIQYLTYRFGPQVLSKTAAKQLLRASGQRIKGRDINRLARELVESRKSQIGSNLRGAESVTGIIADNLTGWMMGGPMGVDNAAVGGPTVADNSGLGSIPQSGAEAARDYVNSPDVDEHSSTPTPSGDSAGPGTDGGSGSDGGGGAGGADAGPSPEPGPTPEPSSPPDAGPPADAGPSPEPGPGPDEPNACYPEDGQ